jgi:hypothetical protein
MTMISRSFQTIVKRFAPKRILRVRKNLIGAQIRQQYGRLSVAEAFNQTYHQKLWGNLEGEEFFSGQGSLEAFAKPYTSWLARFITEKNVNKCADIIEDKLPEGDLCLIRQVLQHLSNRQISRVLANCTKFPYLVVTEDVYSGPRVRVNLDIMHGPTTGYLGIPASFSIARPSACGPKTFSKYRALKLIRS